MVIGADPSCRIHRPFESGLDGNRLSRLNREPALHQVVFGTPRDSEQVVARGNLLGKRSVVGVVLVIAAVGPIVRAEIRGRGPVDTQELDLGR